MEKIVKKLYFAWGMDKEKAWLESMAKEGWILKHVSFGKYTFLKDEPKDLVYEFDFNILSKEQEAEYLSYFSDWTYIDTIGGWYYFYIERKEDIDISIFNNNESRRKMIQRLLIFLFIVSFPLYYSSFIMIPNLNVEFPSFYYFFRIFLIIIVALHLFATIKIFMIYRKLSKQIRQ
jgi:hypothetical protein